MRYVEPIEPRRNTACPVCQRPINVGGYKGQHTCGRSECQQEDTQRNIDRFRKKGRR